MVGKKDKKILAVLAITLLVSVMLFVPAMVERPLLKAGSNYESEEKAPIETTSSLAKPIKFTVANDGKVDIRELDSVEPVAGSTTRASITYTTKVKVVDGGYELLDVNCEVTILYPDGTKTTKTYSYAELTNDPAYTTVTMETLANEIAAKTGTKGGSFTIVSSTYTETAETAWGIKSVFKSAARIVVDVVDVVVDVVRTVVETVVKGVTAIIRNPEQALMGAAAGALIGLVTGGIGGVLGAWIMGVSTKAGMMAGALVGSISGAISGATTKALGGSWGTVLKTTAISGGAAGLLAGLTVPKSLESISYKDPGIVSSTKSGAVCQKGDIIFGQSGGTFSKLVPGDWSHTCVFAGYDSAGQGWVIESDFFGVHWTKVEAFTGSYSGAGQGYAISRVATDATTKANAVNFAAEQVGKPYDWVWALKEADGPTYYCSELVWGGYESAGLDLAAGGEAWWSHVPGMGVTPEQIYQHSSVQTISTVWGSGAVAGSSAIPWIAVPAGLYITGATSEDVSWLDSVVDKGGWTRCLFNNVIAAGNGGWGAHSLAISYYGETQAWGDNYYGELGDGTTTDRYTPVQVSGLTNVIAISAGGYHSMALRYDGTVWAWGDNDYGQLGDGTTTDRYTPVQVSGLTNVIAISAGGSVHSMALKSDGTVWAWGNNNKGLLGDGTTTERHTPVQSQINSVSAISAGQTFSMALRYDGAVWAWGDNACGQLGDGTTTYRCTPVFSRITNVIAISAGYCSAMALKSDGTVWAWGSNYKGILGDGTTTNRYTPGQVSGLTNVIIISAGWCYTMALKSDGTVWAWGSNGNGVLGDGTTTDRYTPVKVQGLSC